jgi:hypothetical protein
MNWKHGACLIFLLLGTFGMASNGFGEEPRTATDARALAASLPRREAELAQRQRKDVLAEVKIRAREMGVKAPAGELTDLLSRRAHLEIGLDKCRLADPTAASCRALETEMALVEASFRETAGLSMLEFRSGHREAPAPASGSLFTTKSGEICNCSFTVYSSNRWMNRYWGLECNNHGGHGVCSNDVDSLHSAGIGAMTGGIDLYYGAGHAHRGCPDDHLTCFRGPSTEGYGEWGNVCNCDTWHSQYYNPYASWYGGDLTDAPEVYQLSTSTMSAGGTCNSTYLVVQEFIQEHDPWCCDDPMGTLIVSLPLQDGYGSVSSPASAQNCNGGSQSGLYPNCGTFGATIRVAYNCSTYVPPPPETNTCRGYCYGVPPDSTCSCEVGCYSRGDCCYDYQEQCCDPYPQWNGCLQ